MKKRNKKYRPREVRGNALDWAIAGVHTFPVETQRDIMKVAMNGFNKLREGIASRDDWNLVCQALNVGEALCELHIGDNLIDDFHRGHEALHQIALRMLSGKSSTCYAHELAAINEALEMHKIQLQLCTQAEFSRAIVRVTNLINGGAQDSVAKTYARLNGEIA